MGRYAGGFIIAAMADFTAGGIGFAILAMLPRLFKTRNGLERVANSIASVVVFAGTDFGLTAPEMVYIAPRPPQGRQPRWRQCQRGNFTSEE